MPESGKGFPLHEAEVGARYHQTGGLVEAMWEMGSDGRWFIPGGWGHTEQLKPSSYDLHAAHDIEAECIADWGLVPKSDLKSRALGRTIPRTAEGPVDRKPSHLEDGATWARHIAEDGSKVWIRSGGVRPEDLIVED